jgi:hypothetical protein
MHNDMEFVFGREGIIWTSTGMNPRNCVLIVAVEAKFRILYQMLISGR